MSQRSTPNSAPIHALPGQIRPDPATPRFDAVAYLDTLLAQVHLPHRSPVDARGEPLTRWYRSNGQYAITIQSGTPAIRTADGSPPEPAGIPFGSHARLFIAALMRHAKRNKTRRVPLQTSPSAFAAELGLTAGGMQLRSIADQAVRIATSLWQFGEHDEQTGRMKQVNSLLCEEFEADISPQRGVDGRWRFEAWPTEILLSQAVYDRLIDHGAPFDLRAYQALSSNSRAMDIYAYLACRLYRITKPLDFHLYDFAMLFEQNPNPDREMLLKHTRKAIEQALAHYPQASGAVSIERSATLHGRPTIIRLRQARPAIPLQHDD